MAGHSKWAQIKRKKAAVDAKRGAAFTKLIREITVAAREGGGDPAANPRLRLAIQTAKAANMPADNIERAIQKGTGELEGVAYEETTYEGYGPGGAAILIQATTDNANRTVAEIRHLFSRHNGNLGAPNSVAWMFENKGIIQLDASRRDEESALEAALEAGAEDMTTEGDRFIITTEAQDLHSVRDSLEDQGLEPVEAELTMIPTTTITVEGKQAEQLVRLIEALDDHDDVSKVFSNFDIDAETLSSIAS